MNGKYFGERAQQIVIGELAKYGIQIAFPLSDNLPFDLIAIVDNRLFRLQIKGSSQGIVEETIIFDFHSNNFYTGETILYSKDNVDSILGVDLRTNKVYLFHDFENIKTITLRLCDAKNKQKNNINLAEDYLLNREKIENAFDFFVPKLDNFWAKRNKRQYEHVCEICGRHFKNGQKNVKTCGFECLRKMRSKVERPSIVDLQQDIESMSWKSIGRKYDVSDNAVRKWAKAYKLI